LITAGSIARAEQTDEVSQENLKKGRMIMEEVNKRSHSCAEHTFLTMIIQYANNKERTRKLEILNKYDKEGKTKNLIRFTNPNDVKNTALLTLEAQDGNDAQWLYLPILRKSKRIASSAKTNTFVGTDFTFEDLRSEPLDIHQYQYVKEEVLETSLCFVIVASFIPSKPASSGYQKRVLFIRKDIYAPIEIHYYNKDNSLVKKRKDTGFVNIKGNTWRADKTIMENLQEQRRTILAVDKRAISEDLDDMLFTQQELTREN